VSKILAGKHVAQVNFDKWNSDGQKCVAHRNARMRKCAGIQQDEICFVGRGLLYAIDDLVLSITLKALQAMPEFCGEVRQTTLDVSQLGVAVDARLAAAKKIQVGSVYQQKAWHFFVTSTS
jgi:hypothetical protein